MTLLKQGIWSWMLDSRPRNLISGLFTYIMIIPFIIIGLCLKSYQFICFPLYRIGKVKRNGCMHLDRHRLQCLNRMEIFNCLYCGYANGLLSYAREIAARTELYWCPVKHAHRVRDRHSRYHDCLDYGNDADFHARVAAIRHTLTAVTRSGKQS